MDNYHKLRTLPNDAIHRVIWWYGPVIKNPFSSDVPLVEVLTRTIFEDNKLSEQAYTHRAPVSELDIVKIGSIWKGRQRLDEYFGTYQSQQFSFDFTLHEPESVRFNDHKPGSNQWQIPPYLYNLGNIPQAYKYHFFNSTLTKLTTDSGTVVLIPSLEFLTGAVSPAHKQIRYKLLQYPLDELTEMYFKSANIEDGNYVVKMKEGHFDENINLLSYLRLNNMTRKRLSRLWTSIEKTRLMRNGRPYEDRYPEVLPYHPTTMSLAGDGIWIDNNTFLLFRITGVSQPHDFHITHLKTTYDAKEPQENGKEDPEKYIPSSKDFDPGDEEITPENNPHRSAGSTHIRSGVTIIGLPAQITVKEERKEIQSAHRSQPEEEQEISGLSSGDPNNREESKGTAGLRQNSLEDTPPKGLSQGLLKETIEALTNLVKAGDSEVQNFYYIGNKAQESPNLIFCSVHRVQLSRDYTGRWHIAKKVDREGMPPKYILRKFLVAKIELTNSANAYLVEIERKSQSESFSGLLFSNGTEDLTEDDLKTLLISITENKGRYTTMIKVGDHTVQSTLELPVLKFITFKHLEMAKTLKNAIGKAKREGVFI
ncbi:hypothetical protein [Sulfurovum sp.]|uniref:hypothetical protein n=1 Tax=Sulfurovum sp. TaxID=1969726 RepID=UPI00356A8CDD